MSAFQGSSVPAFSVFARLCSWVRNAETLGRRNTETLERRMTETLDQWESPHVRISERKTRTNFLFSWDPVYQRSCVPAYLCSRVPAFMCSFCSSVFCVPMNQGVCVPAFLGSNVPVPQCSGFSRPMGLALWRCALRGKRNKEHRRKVTT